MRKINKKKKYCANIRELFFKKSRMGLGFFLNQNVNTYYRFLGVYDFS
jgi:hypothetical protein